MLQAAWGDEEWVWQRPRSVSALDHVHEQDAFSILVAISTYRSGFSFASRAVAALWTSGCGGVSGLQRINVKLVPGCTFGTPLLSRNPQALAPPGEVA